MAGEPPFYTEIDGKWHEVDAEGDATVCGLALAYPGAVWTRNAPDKVHCGEKAPAKKTKK